MDSAVLLISEEEIGEINDLIDEIIQKAKDGVLGNSRARMLDVQSIAYDIKSRLKALNNGGDAA